MESENKDPKKTKPLAKEIAQLKTKLDKSRQDAGLGEGSSTSPAPDSPLNPATIIRQTYLRTLSRPPTDDELARCQTYFADAAKTA